jgi:tRNA modification GTPase
MTAGAGELIVAVATPPGRGALAVVRASGAGAIDLVSSLAGRSSWVPRRATLVRLAVGSDLVDQAIVTVFPGPDSFTGDDLVEFSLHGSPVLVDALLRTCVAAGARMARRGEFTFRAHLHGRIDLLQAEAINDLVAAVTPAQARVASSHLDGRLSEAIREMGDAIAALRTLLEASLDFPDEGFHFVTPEEVAARITAVEEECRRLLGGADAGRRLHEGALVVIAGPPNAGKSSLFNALLRRPRAIVTEVPGTTRDLLSEVIDLGGVPVTMVDTAGVHETDSAIEREGIVRAREAMAAADVVVVAVDLSAPDGDLHEAEALWAGLVGVPRLCVLTKQDLASATEVARPAWLPDDVIGASVVSANGVRPVEERLGAALGRVEWEGTTLTRARHRSLMVQCATALARAQTLVRDEGSEEFLLADLQDALRALEELRGVETPDDVLAAIFSTFCIGK